MTTYYNGLKVPKTQVEISLQSTDANGQVVFNLAYDPMPTAHQITVLAKNYNQAERPVLATVESLVGKVLTVTFLEPFYDKADSPTATTDAAGSGAVVEPHDHALAYTSTRVTWERLTMTIIGVTIIYEPIGG